MTLFQGMGSRTAKMNKTFPMGNGVLNAVLKIFPQKPPYRSNEGQKTFMGAHFPYLSGSIGPIVSKKNIGFVHVWTRTNHVNFIKIGSKLRPVS